MRIYLDIYKLRSKYVPPSYLFPSVQIDIVPKFRNVDDLRPASAKMHTWMSGFAIYERGSWEPSMLDEWKLGC